MSAGIGGCARAWPDADAIVSFGRRITFGELDERQAALAGALAAGGPERTDRIAVLSANRPELLEVTVGALRCGVVPVPIHRALSSGEVAYQIEDSAARWLFTDERVEVTPGLERVVTFGDAYERLLHSAPRGEPSEVALGRPMHYTSGTTGAPKGVWVEPDDEQAALERSAAFQRMWALSSNDAHLVSSPLSHSAPHRFALRTLEAGGTVIVQSRFDAANTLAAIELFSATTAFMVPTHLERIVRLGPHEVRRHDLSSVRLLAHAGAPVREVTKRALLDLFPAGSVWEFYGSTEGQATRISSDEWLRRPGSVGMAMPGIEVTVLDPDGGELQPEQPGEIWIGGPAVEPFTYWGDPSKTSDAWRGGAFTVGDVGWLDADGYLYLSGRKHDTIITGGVNVYPQEVEHVLADHPAVKEVLVYGSEDEEWGQQVRALVVCDPGESVDARSLRRWAEPRLAAYKCPRVVDVVEEIPRTPSGKPRRPSS